METPSDEKKMITEPLLSTTKEGGFRTLPFIIANEALEKVASYGLMPNMIVYLMGEYGMETTTGSNVLFFWSAATNFMPIVGAFVADSFAGRFRTIGFGSMASLLGLILLWLTAMIPQARPSCNQILNGCEPPKVSQLILLYCSFGLMSIGAGGIRSSSLAFGADQLGKRDNLKSSGSLADLLQLTKTSLFTGFAQVLVASYKNRHLTLSSQNSNRLYYHRKGSTLLVPSEKLRFLNRACTIRNPEQDLNPDGKASDPWSLCTVDQVEELKALLKVIPLWSTGIMMAVNISQNSFPLLQAASMDRHITSNFEIPAGSFSIFMIVSLTVWVPLYNHIILPLASKIRGKPTRLSIKQRMGIGLLLSCVSMAVSAIVETVRREVAIKEGLSDDPQAVSYMSAMWLVPQYCLNGMAEAFTAIAQIEFYYSEFPRSMSSIAATLLLLGMAVANLVASSIMSAVDDVTKRGGKESWLSSNINKGHFDYYCWLLTGLSLLNLMYFLVCSRAYGPCVGEGSRKVWDEEDEMREE
ncbi:hypothetical protein L1049_018785 [Liquidambar formosana]|uniref:NPF family transporter n=1 Tax=Liquidambar formosana TaxID=63359 RepID=A0AAP0WNL9_LIQFO